MNTRRPPRRQTGFALLEILIAMVVVAVWLLAHAGLQLNALKFQHSGQSRLTALALATDLSERMDANRTGAVALAGNYQLDARSSATTTTLNCTVNACSPSDMATYDLAQWSARAASALKIDEMSVSPPSRSGGLVSYTISVRWLEAAGNRNYAAASGADNATTEKFSLTFSKTLPQ